MHCKCILMICLLLPLAAAAQEKGVVLKSDVLVAEPFKDAAKTGALSKGDAVTILKKKGGWYQVKTQKAQGWVRMLSVRRGAATRTDASREAGDVAALSTGRAGTGQIVSTTGVRGLNEEQLKAAKFDGKELKKAESFSVSKADAQAFAAKGKLKGKARSYLP